MPVYEYDCGSCGSFSRFRTLAECGSPAECPECGQLAPKVFPMVNLRAMRPANRKAWERNERSAHAPHVCGAGCGHATSASRNASAKSGKPVLEISKKPNSRPWMLGH